MTLVRDRGQISTSKNSVQSDVAETSILLGCYALSLGVTYINTSKDYNVFIFRVSIPK
jgi:hypothetical protein